MDAGTPDGDGSTMCIYSQPQQHRTMKHTKEMCTSLTVK